MQHRNTSLYQAGLCIKPYESQGILFDHVYKAHNACKYSQVIQLWCNEILTLLESKSTSQTSSGSLKLFLYGRKLAGTPMMNGVGARSSCKIKRNKLPILIHVPGISCSVHHLHDREILRIIKLLFWGRMSFGDLHNSFT